MRIRRICLLIAILVVIGYALSTAEISKLISYQGRITNPDGTPVADGNHTVRFNLYPVPVGGFSQWNETASITTVSGLFSHLLGSVQPIPDSCFFLFDSLFLQVTYEDQIQSPRTQFTPVAYSQRVHSIDKSNGGAVWGEIRLWQPDGSFAYASLNLGADDQAEMSLVGNDRSVLIDLGMSGSSSVQIPQSAIEASEILDEPGVGSCNNTAIVLPTTPTYLCGRTMFAPVDGYVLVVATAHVGIAHTNGTTSNVSFGVSDNISSYVASSLARMSLPSSLPTGIYRFPISSHALFPISAGSHAYYVLGSITGTVATSASEVQFTECFFPTAYTTVSTPVPPQGAVGTVPQSFDPNTERREAEAFHQKRLEAEVAQIKAELEAMREKLDRETTDSNSEGKD